MLSTTDHNTLVAAAENVSQGNLETALAATATEIAALEQADAALPRIPQGLWSVDPVAVERRAISDAAERAHLTFSVLVRRLPLAVQVARGYWQDWTAAS